MIRYEGPFRVYFNRHLDAPLVWIIAPQVDGDPPEILVRAVCIGVTLTTRYSPREQRDDHSGPPAAWFEGTGVVEVGDDGFAFITE